MTQDLKVTENRLRRMAERRGMRLMKSRRRDPQALDFGVYWLVDADTNLLLTPDYGLDLDGIEAWMEG